MHWVSAGSRGSRLERTFALWPGDGHRRRLTKSWQGLISAGRLTRSCGRQAPPRHLSLCGFQEKPPGSRENDRSGRADCGFARGLGELFFGLRRGARLAGNMKELDMFLQARAVRVEGITRITADRYSRLVLELKRQGTPIPTSDVWIAPQSMEHGAELITLDRHFQHVPGLVSTLFDG